MNNKLLLKKAEDQDMDRIMEIIRQAVKVMEAHHIQQWDELYPTDEIIKDDIARKQLYTGYIDGSIAVIFVLNQDFDEDYQNGSWECPGSSCLVVHRLCVNPAFQNQGIGTETMLLIEEIVKKQNIGFIRLDAFSLNPYALKMYEKMGYKRVGQAVWRKGLFYLYEKKIG